MTDDDKALVERLRRTYHKEYAPTRSTVGDISNRLRPFPILATEVLFNPDGREAADRIEAQAKTIETLRAALELADAALSGANMNMNVVERKVRAALQEAER